MDSDRLLNGPTDEAWIDPWISYLTCKGVEFHQGGMLTQLNCDGQKITSVIVTTDSGDLTITADYFIAAVPVEVMTPLVTPAIAKAAPSLAQIGSLYTEWMNGIQFYLGQDVPLDHGHTIYLDSVWALTSVSQRQFWNVNLANFGNGQVGGILSVDISDWTTPGNKVVFKPAEQCTAEEIKEEVWAQLKAHINQGGNSILTDDNLLGWHLDPDIAFPRADAANDENAEPLLVNVANSWQYRPNAATEIPNLLLASDYVRTYTDLATMEGANEAARRAVNAILIESGSSAAPCQLWPLAEPAVFQPCLAQDQARYNQGLPWQPCQLNQAKEWLKSKLRLK